MRRTRFGEEQIINILKGVEAGQRVADACRAHGISELLDRIIWPPPLLTSRDDI